MPKLIVYENKSEESLMGKKEPDTHAAAFLNEFVRLLLIC